MIRQLWFMLGMLYMGHVALAATLTTEQVRLAEQQQQAHTRTLNERAQAQRLEDLKNAEESIKKLRPATTPDMTSPPSDQAQCFPIQSIALSGNHLFSTPELLALLHFSPACLGIQQINDYLRVLTNHYGEQGYVTSRAFLVPQDLSTGILKIFILEGKVEGFLWNGAPQDFLEAAFTGMKNHVLNLRAIEQGLDQINRLKRYHATIKLQPGTKEGFTFVDIQSTEGRFATYAVGWGNTGQKSTGAGQVSFAASADNLFNRLDAWSFNASRDTDAVAAYGSKSVYLSLDLPYGFWNVDYSTSYSAYKNTIHAQGFVFVSSGQVNQHDVTIRRLLHRDATSKTVLSWTIDYRTNKNYIDGARDKSASLDLSATTLALTHSTRLFRGFLTFSPAVSLGTDWFGAQRDQFHDDTTPQAQFVKETLTASYTYPITQSLTWNSTVFGQKTDDNLYSNQQLSIGGEYSVRGFKETSISGDQGYYWRNDLTYQLTGAPWVKDWLGDTNIQWAIDTGRIQTDETDSFEQGMLTGMALIFNASSDHLSHHLLLGKALSSPESSDADNYVVSYQFNLQF